MGSAPEVAQRLYVTAPGDLDLRPLLDGLKRRGAEPYVLSDVAYLGDDLVHSLRRAVSLADRVLVVLTRASALNPVLEAGIALAFGKPLLVIAAPGAPIPSDLKGQFIAQASPDDLDAINFALDHAEAPTAPRDHLKSAPHPTGRPLGQVEAQQLLARLRVGEGVRAERFYANVLLEAIEASRGVGVINAEPGFDLGVWSDDLEAIGGNPLLVEIKRSLTMGTVDQALGALDAHPSARLALIVYTEPSPQAELARARFPVLVISIQELIERMGDASFAEIVRGLRNQSAHGQGPL